MSRMRTRELWGRVVAARAATGVARAARRAALGLLALGLALWGALAWPPAVGAQPGGEEAIDIAAETLTVETEAQQARFSGEVVVRRGDWVLRCPALVAHYDAQGGLESAQADGPVELAGPGFWAQAGTARYEREPSEAIVLGGEPRVRRGQSVLRADEVRVDLVSGTVEMRGVRGRLVVPRDGDGAGADAP